MSGSPSRAPRPSRRHSRAARPSRLWPDRLQLCPERRSVLLKGLPHVAPKPLGTADPAGLADQAFPSRHRWASRLPDIVRRAARRLLRIVAHSPTVTANHASERGPLTRGSTGRISMHGGNRQHGGRSKPCEQGCGAAKQMPVRHRMPQSLSCHKNAWRGFVWRRPMMIVHLAYIYI